MQLARLGDLVQTWPLLRHLRRVYPGARLGLLVDQPLIDLARLGPPVDELYGLDLKKIAFLASFSTGEAYRCLSRCLDDLQGPGFDLVFNLNFSRLSLLLAYLLGHPVIGYRPVRGGREFWREPWLALVYGLVHARVFSRIHLSDVFRHLAPQQEMKPVPPMRMASSKEPVIALQLATRHPKRTWPRAHFARLASLLIEKLGARLWLLGTAEEQAGGDELVKSLKPCFRERLVNLQGRTDLAELAARLTEADLLVSGDTGTLHLAAALGTPVVAVFLGPASCFETGPYGSGHIVIQAEPPCHPCREAGPECPEPLCQRAIVPELVAEVILARFGLKKSPGPEASLPAKVRIYGSFWDGFGVCYAIRQGRPPDWVDLTGWAYRAAGARLLKHPPPQRSLPLRARSDADIRVLRHLAKALENGNPAAIEPPAGQALAPLLAFGAVLQRQAIWKGGECQASAWVQEVRDALGEELGKFIH